jgi:hypothetical protein
MDADIAALPPADDGVAWIWGTLLGLIVHPELVQPLRRPTSRFAQVSRAIVLSANGVGLRTVAAAVQAREEPDDEEVDDDDADVAEE